MINLYDVQTTDFTKNGDATVRALRCELMLSINGGWSLELELPYDKDGTYMVTSGSSRVAKVGKWNLIQEGAVIGVDIGCVREQWVSGKTSSRQFFRIYDYRKTLKSITAIAYPIAMECNQDVLIDNLAISKTPAQTMADLQAYTNKYTLSTNISATARAFSISNTNLGAAIAVSFIDVFGGEIVYNNFNIGVREKIGDQNNASKYPVIYGRNMTGIHYEKDDSGIVTRICPISQDGIRLNGSGYVDSPIADSYPYLHKRYMSAPYRLLIDDQNNNSITAVTTAQALQAIKTASMTPAQTLTNNLVHGEIPIPFAYIKSIRTGGDDDKGIIESVQDMATAEIYQESMLSKFRSAIKDGMNDKVNGAWAITEHEWTWHEDTSVTPHAWWYGYDSNEYARNCYIKIGKYYEYFNDDGYWEEYKRLPFIDWHQNGDGSWSIGYREGYYAHNEYVYMTVEGQMKEWWYDSDGWYDDDSSGDSDFGWHGNAQDGLWFGEEDAGSGDKSKYLHDCWAFIDGIYYFFDQYGYTDADPVHSLPDYQWGRQIDEKTGKEWFGNTDKSYGAKWLYNQWIKFASETSETNYWYVDENGYVRDEKDSKAAVIQQYTTGLANIKTVCNTQRDTLYALLYRLMTEWCNKQYSEGVDRPTLTLTVSIVDLSKTTEYKNYEQLEKICLGDKVRCQDIEHNIYSQERIMGLVYDCIRGYNTSVVIGHSEASLGSILSGGSGSSVPSGFDTSAMETALTTQGNAIATLQNGKQDKLTAGDNITIVNNRISANVEGGLKYWHETANRFYREGTHEGISGDEGTVKVGQEIGNYVNGDGWTRCLVFRMKNTTAPYIMGVGEQAWDTMQIVIATTNQADLDFEWGYSNNTLVEPYGVEEWFDKDEYTGGYDTASVTYNGKTWYCLQIHPARKYGFGCAISGISKFFSAAYNDDVATNGLKLLQACHATDHIEVVTEIATETYVFKYGGDDKTYTYIDTDGNALFKEITTDSGSLTSQMARKQNLLTAGENIQINGNTISATDTTYEEFDGDGAGLVPAVQTQSGKFLKDDGTWGDAGGGTDVEANPSGSATSTLTKLRVDDTIYGISGGGGGGASIIGLSMSEYRALTPTEKHDEEKLYMVETDEDITPLNMANMTKYQGGSVGISSTSDTTTLTWSSGTDIGQTYYYTNPIDLTDVDKIRYTIVTGGCFNTDSGWAPNPVRDLGIGVRDTAPSGVVLISSMNFVVYNEYEDTDVNSTFIDEELDVSGLSGNYYLIGTAAGWNAVITNIVLVNSIDQERRIYWDDKNWAGGTSGANQITYGTTTPTGDANDGDLYILLDSNNSKQGEYLYMNNAWVQIE